MNRLPAKQSILQSYWTQRVSRREHVGEDRWLHFFAKAGSCGFSGCCSTASKKWMIKPFRRLERTAVFRRSLTEVGAVMIVMMMERKNSRQQIMEFNWDAWSMTILILVSCTTNKHDIDNNSVIVKQITTLNHYSLNPFSVYDHVRASLLNQSKEKLSTSKWCWRKKSIQLFSDIHQQWNAFFDG